MWEWIQAHPVWSGLGITVASLAVSALVVPPVLQRIPADYFRHPPRPFGWRGRTPAGVALWMLRNLLGGALVVAGIAMLVLPGQGILTILIGLVLMDFPGKRRGEVYLLRKPTVARAVTWIRSRAKQPPLEIPD